MEQEYIITVFSENKVGLLSQITTVFTCRNVNIESLTTSESALAGIHKFTIVVRTDPEKIEKLARQVEKRIDVLKVFVFTSDEVVQQEIALYKVTRSRNVEQLVRRHNVRILEIDDDYIVVEKTGPQGRDQGAVPPAAALRRAAVRAQRHRSHHQIAARTAQRVPRRAGTQPTARRIQITFKSY